AVQMPQLFFFFLICRWVGADQLQSFTGISNFFFQLKYLLERTQGYLQDGVISIEAKQVLVQITYGCIPAPFNGTLRRKVFAGQELEQCRFTGTIITDQTDP